MQCCGSGMSIRQAKMSRCSFGWLHHLCTKSARLPSFLTRGVVDSALAQRHHGMQHCPQFPTQPLAKTHRPGAMQPRTHARHTRLAAWRQPYAEQRHSSSILMPATTRHPRCAAWHVRPTTYQQHQPCHTEKTHPKTHPKNTEKRSDAHTSVGRGTTRFLGRPHWSSSSSNLSITGRLISSLR